MTTLTQPKRGFSVGPVTGYFLKNSDKTIWSAKKSPVNPTGKYRQLSPTREVLVGKKMVRSYRLDTGLTETGQRGQMTFVAA